ncbi:glycosyltransferase [Aeromonas caviae]
MINRTQDEILSQWGRAEKVVMSVCCIAYNQEDYISQTIDGFLMQETSFPFEIIIGEDCSSDNTLAILREYQDKYPDIIYIISSKNNVGVTNNVQRVLSQAKGKYISFCEGDDYWTDDKKLTKHFEFLERNRDISLHVFDCLEWKNGQVIAGSSKLNRLGIRKGRYSKEDLRDDFCLMLQSSCFINFNVVFPSYFYKSSNTDTLLNIMLSQYGGAFVDAEEKVAVYRHLDSGIWSKKGNDHKFYESMHNILVHSRYFNELNDVISAEKKITSMIVISIRKIGLLKFIKYLVMSVVKKLV